MSKTIVLTEDISMPIDEGIKKFSFHLAKFYSKKNKDNKIFSSSRNSDLPDLQLMPANKLLFAPSFFKQLSGYKAQEVIYVPSSSSTLMSFVRLKLVSLFTGSAKSIMVSVQERKHGKLAKKLISWIKPSEVVVLSNKQASYYKSLGINCKVSPIGVDTKKFVAVKASEKQDLREKLRLPLDAKIVLHVGHINKGRNLCILKGLLAAGYQIVIIGSTRFESDDAHKSDLEKEGFLFVNHYIEKIEEYYQASDIYVFPVKAAKSAMEFPLSVLEAMASNIPVVTTRFGGLENFFIESKWFKYFSDEKDLLSSIHSFPKDTECDNRSKVIESFTWEKIFASTFQNKN
jgi:glycosyltransferase involved in cell wall biosynthesis